MWFYQLTISNSYKFEITVNALKKGRIVNKQKGYRFQIGDYLMYNKEQDFYYNLSYALIKNLYWNTDLIAGYVANDDLNIDNNGNKDKTSIIEFVGNEF